MLAVLEKGEEEEDEEEVEEENWVSLPLAVLALEDPTWEVEELLMFSFNSLSSEDVVALGVKDEDEVEVVVVEVVVV